MMRITVHAATDRTDIYEGTLDDGQTVHVYVPGLAGAVMRA